jgi:uncharacterized Zn finger protein (UPF0148 family)
MAGIGIPYAQANDDGSVTCPECGERCEGVDESHRTAEDAMTKGAGRVYAEHYAEKHEATDITDRVRQQEQDHICERIGHKLETATGICARCERTI